MNQPTPVNRGLCSFLVGTTYPLRALGALIQYPQLRPYVLVPIGLNLVLGIVLYGTLLQGGLHWIDTWISSVPQLAGSAQDLAGNLVGDLAGDLARLRSPEISPPAAALGFLSALHWPSWLHWPGALSWPSWLHWPSALSWPNWLHWPSWLHLPAWPQIAWPDWKLPLPAWQLPGWLAAAPLELVEWLLRLVLTVLLLIVTGFFLLQFGFILGAPFYGKLSEAIERLKTGQVELVEISPWQEVGRAILYELKKLGLVVTIGLPLLLLNLLPGIGTAIATLGTITLSSTLVCLDFFDATLERRRLKFRQKLGIVRRALPASGGFGLVCFGLVSIPLINLLAIPLCVMAGTLFCCDRILPLRGESISSESIRRESIRGESESGDI
jgi:CysZ protein